MAKIATVWFKRGVKSSTDSEATVIYLRVKGKLYRTECKAPNRSALMNGHKPKDALKKALIEEAIRADLGCGSVVADEFGSNIFVRQYEHNGVRFQYGK